MRLEPSNTPSGFLLTELRSLQSDLRSYNSDSQRTIKNSLPVLNDKIHVLETSLHSVLVWACTESSKANADGWANADAVYEVYTGIRKDLLSHVVRKIGDLSGSNSIKNIWFNAFSKDKSNTSIENKQYLNAFSETEDFLWLARKIFECELSHHIPNIDEKMSQMKSRFLVHLQLIELSTDDQKKIKKLLSQIEDCQLTEPSEGLAKIDELEKFVRG